MDIYMVLAVIVALVTVVSGYLLFNEVPTLGPNADTRRQTRRP